MIIDFLHAIDFNSNSNIKIKQHRALFQSSIRKFKSITVYDNLNIYWIFFYFVHYRIIIMKFAQIYGVCSMVCWLLYVRFGRTHGRVRVLWSIWIVRASRRKCEGEGERDKTKTYSPMLRYQSVDLYSKEVTLEAMSPTC